MSKRRTRHPDEPRVGKNGKLYNERSHHPLKYADPEQADAIKQENLHVPSDRMLAVVASGAVLRPRQIAWVRQGIINIVERNLQKASDVLDGSAKWDGNQTRLFLGFLDKVAPRMSDNIHRHEMQPTARDYANLSRAELQAALDDVMNDAKVIEAEPTPKPKRKTLPRTTAIAAMERRKKRQIRLSVAEAAARRLEQPETILPPLTRKQDDEIRRQRAKSAAGLRKQRARSDALKDLELMAQLDPVVEAAEKFIKTPPSEAE
jgi:hypothetical protein